MHRWGLIVGLGLFLALGCDDDGDPPASQADLAPVADAAVDATTGGVDSGSPEPEPSPDMMADLDSATPDMGAPEADAEVPDAEVPEADAEAPGADAGEPEADAAAPGPDAGEPEADAAAPEPDAGEPEADAGLPLDGVCSPCDDDGDCVDALGAEAQCAELIGSRGCLPGCADNDDCQEGFLCFESACVPGGARCDSCVVAGCPEGQRCNGFNGDCEDRTGRCGGCREDEDCADGLFCRELGFGRNCLPACMGDEDCGEGFACDAGICLPEAGACDACGGCVGERPVCNIFTRECVECAVGAPCPEGEVCNEGTCEAPADGTNCLTDLDCRDDALPFCVEEQCVACREDGDCDIGAACVEGACAEAEACDRVTCQDGTACADGVCLDPEGNPGCVDDAGCPGDEFLCNPATGQCYREDQQCDPDGLTAVCHPGGECVPNPINAMENVCTCARRDPNDFGEPNEEHRIPCQPGGTCLQLGNQPGVCASFGG